MVLLKTGWLTGMLGLGNVAWLKQVCETPHLIAYFAVNPIGTDEDVTRVCRAVTCHNLDARLLEKDLLNLLVEKDSVLVLEFARNNLCDLLSIDKYYVVSVSAFLVSIKQGNSPK